MEIPSASEVSQLNDQAERKLKAEKQFETVPTFHKEVDITQMWDYVTRIETVIAKELEQTVPSNGQQCVKRSVDFMTSDFPSQATLDELDMSPCIGYDRAQRKAGEPTFRAAVGEVVRRLQKKEFQDVFARRGSGGRGRVTVVTFEFTHPIAP